MDILGVSRKRSLCSRPGTAEESDVAGKPDGDGEAAVGPAGLRGTLPRGHQRGCWFPIVAVTFLLVTTKQPDKTSSKKGKFIFSSQFEDTGKSLPQECEEAGHIAPAVKDAERAECWSRLIPFYSVGNPSPCNYATHI